MEMRLIRSLVVSVLPVIVTSITLEVDHRGTVRRHVATSDRPEASGRGGRQTPELETPELTCNKMPIRMNFCDGEGNPRQFHSNLGGKGPGEGDEEFRMSGVAVVDETVLDLVVKVAEGSNYESFRQNQNVNGGGAYVSPQLPSENGPACYAMIPFKTSTETKFVWRLVKTNTYEEFQVAQVRLTILDFDHEKGRNNEEYVLLDTPVSGIQKGSDVRVLMEDGTMKLESTTEGDSSDNPATTGLPLSDLQKSRAVEIGYTDVSNWRMTFGSKGGTTNSDRVFEITGSISTCPEKLTRDPEPIEMKFCDPQGNPLQHHSNLAGKGPDNGVEEFRVNKVAKVDGTELDFVLTVAEGATYTSYRQNNGVNGGGVYITPKLEGEVGPTCFVVIPFEVRSQTKFHWALVNSETNEPFNVAHLRLSILDFDQETNDDNEYVLLNTPVSSMHKGDCVEDLVTQDGSLKLRSRTRGDSADNPARAGINDLQKSRAVELGYKGVSSWDITFGAEGGDSSGDRVFEIFGSIWQNAPDLNSEGTAECIVPADSGRGGGGRGGGRR